MLTKKYDNHGRFKTFNYDEKGNLAWIRDEEGAARTFEYDDLGYTCIFDSDKLSSMKEMRPPEAMHLEYGCYPEKKINAIIEQASL